MAMPLGGAKVGGPFEHNLGSSRQLVDQPLRKEPILGFVARMTVRPSREVFVHKAWCVNAFLDRLPVVQDAGK